MRTTTTSHQISDFQWLFWCHFGVILVSFCWHFWCRSDDSRTSVISNQIPDLQCSHGREWTEFVELTSPDISRIPKESWKESDSLLCGDITTEGRACSIGHHRREWNHEQVNNMQHLFRASLLTLVSVKCQYHFGAASLDNKNGKKEMKDTDRRISFSSIYFVFWILHYVDEHPLHLLLYRPPVSTLYPIEQIGI